MFHQCSTLLNFYGVYSPSEKLVFHQDMQVTCISCLSGPSNMVFHYDRLM